MIKLPKGIKAVKDKFVGISYEDDMGNIVLQHPKDTDYSRRMLYCLCPNPTSHSSGEMKDGSCPIICQSCGKEMFVKGIHSITEKRVEMNYAIRLLEGNKECEIERVSQLRRIIDEDTLHIKENKKEIEKIEKRIEEMDTTIGMFKYQTQEKEDNVKEK